MLFPHPSLLLACLSALVSAAPYTSREEKRTWPAYHDDHGDDHDDSRSFYDWSSRRGHNWRGRGSTSYQPSPAGQCDLASVQMPSAPTPLPPVSEGFKLYHVAVGRGTQNYTCDLSNSTAVPVAAGAVASLFNVTCLAAQSPLLLDRIPSIALALPIPVTSTANLDLSGHHYFTDSTTAYFNLDTHRNEWGRGGFKKINSTAAPSDACVGQNNQGYGAVPWLKLTSKEDEEEDCVFQEVYRINTAGGQPPKNCVGQQDAFEIEYSAEYWFYEPGKA